VFGVLTVARTRLHREERHLYDAVLYFRLPVVVVLDRVQLHMELCEIAFADEIHPFPL